MFLCRYYSCFVDWEGEKVLDRKANKRKVWKCNQDILMVTIPAPVDNGAFWRGFTMRKELKRDDGCLDLGIQLAYHFSGFSDFRCWIPLTGSWDPSLTCGSLWSGRGMLICASTFLGELRYFSNTQGLPYWSIIRDAQHERRALTWRRIWLLLNSSSTHYQCIYTCYFQKFSFLILKMNIIMPTSLQGISGD